MTPSDGRLANHIAPAVAPALAVALDVPDLDEALRIAHLVRRSCAVAKVGLELFASTGPQAVRALLEEDFEVFLDLKMHDIPTTVGRAATAVGRLGATYLTVHGAGGAQMLAAAVEGFAAGREESGRAGTTPAVGRTPGILAVTVLTSMGDAPASLIADRCELAAATGCTGVICAASDLPTALRTSPALLRFVPGIRNVGDWSDDQARIATPRAAAAAGASVLVVGRPVTRADDPAAAARTMAAESVAGVLPR